MRIILLAMSAFLIISCKPVSLDSNTLNSSDTSVSSWDALLVSADNSIDAFDNARKTLNNILRGSVRDVNLSELSARSKENISVTTTNSIISTVEQFSSTSNDACFVHLTSHGRTNGLLVNSDETPAYTVNKNKQKVLKMENFLSPEALSKAVEKGCGDRPTIIFVSACYSGVFSDYEGLRKPNIAILTAASATTTSFGCGVENEYTYWDGCLVDNLPISQTINDLSLNMNECVDRKEGRKKANLTLYDGEFKAPATCRMVRRQSSQPVKRNNTKGLIPSNPQTFIGEKMQGFALPTYAPQQEFDYVVCE